MSKLSRSTLTVGVFSTSLCTVRRPFNVSPPLLVFNQSQYEPKANTVTPNAEVSGLSDSHDRTMSNSVSEKKLEEAVLTLKAGMDHIRHWFPGFSFQEYLEISVLARFWLGQCQLYEPNQVRAIVFLAAKFFHRDFDLLEKLMKRTYGTSPKQLKQEQLAVFVTLMRH